MNGRQTSLVGSVVLARAYIQLNSCSALLLLYFLSIVHDASPQVRHGAHRHMASGAGT